MNIAPLDAKNPISKYCELGVKRKILCHSRLNPALNLKKRNPQPLVSAEIDCGFGMNEFDEMKPGPQTFVSAEIEYGLGVVSAENEIEPVPQSIVSAEIDCGFGVNEFDEVKPGPKLK